MSQTGDPLRARYQHSKTKKAQLIKAIQAKGRQVAAELTARQIPWSKSEKHLETKVEYHDKLWFGFIRVKQSIPRTLEIIDSAFWLVDKIQTSFKNKELIRYHKEAYILDECETVDERIYLDSSGCLWLARDAPTLSMRKGGEAVKGWNYRTMERLPEADFCRLDGERSPERKKKWKESSPWGMYQFIDHKNGRDPRRPEVDEWGLGLMLALDNLRRNGPVQDTTAHIG